MGFLTGQYLLAISTVLLRVTFLFACVKSAALWMIQRLGLTDDDFSSFSERTQNDSSHSSASSSSFSATAKAIREWLPVSSFGEYVQRCGGTMDDETECAVCLITFQEDEEIRELCNCRHIFHRTCLDKWLDHRQMTCPLCRCFLMSQEEIQMQNQSQSHSYSWIVDTISFVFANDMQGYES